LSGIWKKTKFAKWWLTVPVLLGLIALSQMAYAASSPAASTVIRVGPAAAAVIGLLYYLSYSPWLGGLDYFWLYRPLVGGFLVGIVLGRPLEGAIVGATINLAYLGFISAGGSLPGDPSLAGYLGTTVALVGHLAPTAAMALAVPIGLLGTIVWNFMMTANSIFVHRADAAASHGDIAEVQRAALWYPQAFLFLITAVPVFFAAWIGAPHVAAIVAGVPQWLTNGLEAAGGVLAALGIAINMRFIFRGPAIGFFLIGFVAVELLHWGLIPLAVIGAGAAYVYVTLKGSAGSSKGVTMSGGAN
jgi:mannose/fructose/N-acetylgalactosamine-specific phosphotransferase system component IIC